MTRKFLTIFGLIFVFIGILSINTNAQNRQQDKEERFEVRFARGKSSAVFRKQIRLGTTHLYSVRARDGQNMTVLLKTGNKTSFTIFSPTDGIIEGADGETKWRGILNKTGEYLIAIGTDKTASYVLEINIR